MTIILVINSDFQILSLLLTENCEKRTTDSLLFQQKPLAFSTKTTRKDVFSGEIRKKRRKTLGLLKNSRKTLGLRKNQNRKTEKTRGEKPQI